MNHPELHRIPWRATCLVPVLLSPLCLHAQDPGDNAEDNPELIELSPFEVSSSSDIGYLATQTLAGTRIRTDLRDVGTAISIVTSEFLQDTGATDNSTLLQYTTNAEVGGTQSTYAGLGNGSSLDELSTLRAPGGTENRVRGLSPADNARDFFVSDIPWDAYNVERIDIQRGPNAILFGLGKPAGMINASLDAAQFFNAGEIQLRFGSYGSTRGSFDLNQEIIDDTLAIRIEGLMDRQNFRQDPAFEDDERIYATLRYDPDLFRNPSFQTSIRVKYEHGDIDANRPRVVPPNDRITPWFNDLNRALIPSGYDAEYEGEAIAGDGRGLTRSADPDFEPWFENRGNQQQPLFFMDGLSGETQRIYAGYINRGVRDSDGSLLSTSSALPGLNYSGVFYGIRGLPGYANEAQLPGYQYGQYREQTLTDPTIFDFYETLIDGPNKSEWENWDAYNIDLSQTAFNNRLGIELIYDYQEYDRGGESFLGWAPAIDVDVLENFQDLNANPNAGRPYVQGNGNGSSYYSEREHYRASLFAEFRAEDVLDDGFLRKLIGIHRFNGVFAKEEFFREERGWRLYANDLSWNDYMGFNLAMGDRPPVAMIYLGDSLSGRNTAAGANIPGIGKRLFIDDGPVYHFNTTWNAPASVAFNAPWTVPGNLSHVFEFGEDADPPMQNSNPANYVGWNSDHVLNVLRFRDGDEDLYTRASKSFRELESWIGTWQGYWWDGAIVGTVGWRYDKLKSKQVSAQVPPASENPLGLLDLSPENYSLPRGYQPSEVEGVHSLSWGVVVHLNDLLERDPLPINISLSYNTSENFEVTGARRNIYGDILENPTGETKDWGILLATKDNRFSFRAVKYEANSYGTATPMSGLDWFGNIISFGERWANVMEYDLNVYTMDTANGSNEWRYNFDPDESIGETQEEATARENASVAAWRAITEWLPDSFYDYWGWDPSEVYAYPLYGVPAGLTLTSDTASEGYELEFTANPTNNWRITFNASKTEATRSNVGGPAALEFVEFISEQMLGPAGEMRIYSGGPTALTQQQQWNSSFLGNWTLLKLQEGASAPEIRKWRFNLVTNYSFSEGSLKGLSFGGSYRWQDEVIVGYPVVAVDEDTFTFDLASPYRGPTEDAVDLWVGYQRALTDRIDWSIQLNIRNAFASDGLIPISVQPDGETWASARVKPDRQWFITNTFSF